MRIKQVLFILLGAFILAFGMYNVHSLVNVCEGGVIGLTLFFEHWFDISPGVTGFILNFICYVIGWKLLGKDFLINSIIATFGFSISYLICEQFDYIYPNLVNYPYLAAIIGAIFVGVGVGICIKANSAPTGDDSLAMSISKVCNIDIRISYLITDISVFLLSLSYIHGLSKILSSIITMILSGQIIGLMQKIKINK